MKNWIAVCAAFSILGCGPEPAPPAGSEDPNDPGFGGPTIPLKLPVLAAGTERVKVVIRKSDLVPQQVFDDEGFPTGETVMVPMEVFRYVTNVPATTEAVAMPMGTGYRIEIVAGDAPTGGEVLAYYSSDLFDVTSVATVSPTLTEQGLTPTFTFPPFFAGLTAPYDKYTVAIGNTGYPWASGFTVEASEPSGTLGVVRGSQVTFPAPATTGPITYTGTFLLDRTMLAPGEAATAWVETVVTTASPTPTGTVIIVP